ncbi:MAG: hypothetical protein KAG96_07260 [Ichthyobacteriaceae bacterium]|nr:hypothetical protein [Ichthyobacteriaceae bacterium]
MLKNSLYIFALLILSISSCKKDFTVNNITQSLKFSADTVYLDTIFSNIGSSTYTLKVYNQENNWVSIPKIKLGRENNSFYRLNINGKNGYSQNNIEIAPKDSIYIFIETTIDSDKTTNPLYVDSLIFESNTINQNVKLVTLVEDANFLFPKKGENSIAIKNYNWTNDKPYVIYGQAYVEPNNTLTINAGTRVHFHSKSSLKIMNDATLIVNGEFENEVTFEGDRLEYEFEEAPGQWDKIWLSTNSVNNVINYANIKNATVGLKVDSTKHTSTPTLKISNTKIFNTTKSGIQAYGSKIEADNLVINNCRKYSIEIYGGNHSFIHSTIVDYWNGNPRLTPAVSINNNYFSNGSFHTINLKNAYFGNCIIYGNNFNELGLNEDESAEFVYKLENTLIKSTLDVDDIKSNTNFVECMFNEAPLFWDAYNNDLRITEKSPIIGKANTIITQQSPIDILQINRTQNGKTDMGAYQNSEKPEELISE